MKKYMKYEIKGTYKFILGILAIIILASSVIQFNIFNEIKSFEYNQVNESMNLLRFMFILSIFIIFGAFITAFFYIIGSFRKELYEDRGYLTFTLPLTGNQIVGSKLLIALMWNFIMGVVIVLYNILLGIILFKGEIRVIFEEFTKLINMGSIISIFLSMASIMLSLILIYFSISLSKVSIKNKKIGGMWFIIFLILSGVISYLVSKMGQAMPYFIDLNNLKIVTLDQILNAMRNSLTGLNIMIGNSGPSGLYPGYINIASLITEILFGVVFFMGTGYLIEEKIDL